MTKQQGQQIADSMRNKGLTLTGWARSKGLCIYTVRGVLFNGLGAKRGGSKTNAVRDALKEDGFINKGSQPALN